VKLYEVVVKKLTDIEPVFKNEREAAKCYRWAMEQGGIIGGEIGDTESVKLGRRRRMRDIEFLEKAMANYRGSVPFVISDDWVEYFAGLLDGDKTANVERIINNLKEKNYRYEGGVWYHPEW